jgi:hypothetical protein
MKSNTLRLVSSKAKKKLYYVASKKDYLLLCKIRVPLRKITEDMLPLLKQRCRKAKIDIAIRSFSLLEEAVFLKIKERWSEVTIDRRSGVIHLDISNKNKKEKTRLEDLVEALANFYERHLYATDIAIGRKTKKYYRVILTMELNHEKEPGWKN